MKRFNSFGVGASLLLFSILSSCEDKKAEPDSGVKFMPVRNFIQNQVSKVDTSLYPIRVITIKDSANSDTLYVHRNEFKTLARDFLNLPDLNTPEMRKRYTSVADYDSSIGRVMFIYTPKAPEEEEIQTQQVLIKPDLAAGDKVSSIFVQTVKVNRDSSVQKMLLWKMDNSFTVTTIRRLAGQAETTSRIKVLWNDNEFE